jgi:[acyl-carrier-protein] S-malonyltransferase
MSQPEKFALAFPGQGSQFVGMGEAAARASKSAFQVYQRANAALGFDIMRHCFEDPEGRLTGSSAHNIRPDTKIIQPAIVATGLAYTAMLREGGVNDEQFAAGHSLGQTTAAGAEGVLSVEEAVTLAAARGASMGEYATSIGAKVYLALAPSEAILRQKLEDLRYHPEARKILDSFMEEFHSWQVTVSNAANRFVIGGLDKHSALLKLIEGVKFRPYDDAPLSHHPVMEPAQRAYNVVLEGVKTFADPYKPILDDMSGSLKKTAEEVIGPFKKHIVTGIKWSENESVMALTGAEVLEVGGNILTSLAPKDRLNNYHPLQTIEQIREAIARFGTPRVSITI